ncbi:MAG: histidine--tRNA ligase, partial [candidate division WOR-3 bacterium]
ESEFRRLAELYGFREVVTPIIEHTELFVKSTGTSSDIVTKEMYTFQDRSGRSLTLRPEGTPGAVRAVLENRVRVPCRLYYIGPMFRYSRPQKGRYREFYQLGVESLGEARPEVDAEIIALGFEFLAGLGISNCRPEINSIGCRECRPAYHERLKEYLQDRTEQFCADCRIRYQQNPLRVFDCKMAACQELLSSAPRSLDHLCSACAEHFAGVQNGLSRRGVPSTTNDRLVRGLDYYSRTAFEYSLESGRAQDSLGGGGRYDYLVEDVGGPSLPAIGFALGEERILLALGEPGGPEARLCWVVPLGPGEFEAGVKLLTELRSAGIAARMDFDRCKPKQQLHSAASAGAQFALILGPDELAHDTVSVKNLKTGVQQEVPRAALAAFLGEPGAWPRETRNWIRNSGPTGAEPRGPFLKS